MGLIGNPQPRLFTPEARPLTPDTSRGFECAEFARTVIGEPFLPWQENAVIRALELNTDGTYRFRIVLIIVGRQSGKTYLTRTVSLWRMFCDGAQLIVGAAQDLPSGLEPWKAAGATIRSVPDLAAELSAIHNGSGKECIYLTGGQRYLVKAANRSAGRGLSVDFLALDEIRELTDYEAYAALAPTINARRNSMIWATTNAGADDSVVLDKLRSAALAGNNSGICLLEWSAPDFCDLDDHGAWVQSCPGLGYVTDEATIQLALDTFPAPKFRTEILCQKVTVMNGAVDLNAWSDCGDPAGTMDSVRSGVCAGIDAAPDGAHATLAVAAKTEAGVRIEIVASWKSTAEARRELPALLERIRPRAVGWFPTGPAAALAALMRSYKPMEITGAKVSEACQQFADLVQARRLTHNHDPLLDSQLANASKLASGDGWRFSRKQGFGHVDACYAAAAAVHAALGLPPASRPRILVPA